MRKIDGLKFLQKYFPDLTVDCIFVDKVENLDEQALFKKDEAEQIWRVRGGRKTGFEVGLPQGTFNSPKDVKKFIKEQQKRDSNMDFVIHRVSPQYFSAHFVGTLAVYNKGNIPGIKIELQKVTKELVDSIDKGKGPRDWEACLILDYEFLSKSPRILKKESFLNMDFLKNPIVVIHEVGEEIFRIYEENGQVDETYTRFNIYDLGQVVFDDHRSRESFVQKYRVSSREYAERNTFQIQSSKEENEIEL